MPQLTFMVTDLLDLMQTKKITILATLLLLEVAYGLVLYIQTLTPRFEVSLCVGQRQLEDIIIC